MLNAFTRVLMYGVQDCDLLDNKLTSIDMDIIFAKIKDKGSRRISFSQLEDGINEIATKKA